MSHSMILLKLLIERGPLSANQMVEATGLSVKQVTDALHSLRVRKAMQMGERPYQATDAGRDLVWNREARAQRLVAKAKQPKRPVGRPKKKVADMPVVRRFIVAPAHADSIVAGAVQSQPALQAAWGVLA